MLVNFQTFFSNVVTMLALGMDTGPALSRRLQFAGYILYSQAYIYYDHKFFFEMIKFILLCSAGADNYI